MYYKALYVLLRGLKKHVFLGVICVIYYIIGILNFKNRTFFVYTVSYFINIFY